jgi:hypothetical protein
MHSHLYTLPILSLLIGYCLGTVLSAERLTAIEDLGSSIEQTCTDMERAHFSTGRLALVAGSRESPTKLHHSGLADVFRENHAKSLQFMYAQFKEIDEKIRAKV